MKYLIAVLLLISPILAQARDVCGERVPQISGFDTIHGVVPSQFEIDPDRHRARLGKRSRLIEIERLWGLGGKTVLPEMEFSGRIQAVQIDLYLKLDTLAGVRFWSLGMAEGSRELENLMPRDSEEIFVHRGDRNEWRSLFFQLGQPIPWSKGLALKLNARTIFHQPWNPKNIIAGTRVDACVYFFSK